MKKMRNFFRSRRMLLVVMVLGSMLIGVLATRPQQRSLRSSDLLRTYRDGQEISLQTKTRQLIVELALTDASRQQGLSQRESIGSDGVLFVFPTAGILSFWMKEMRFDLDIIWLRDGEVVDVTLAVPKPEPNQSLTTLPVIRPRLPANQVLEVEKGKVQDWGITVGDRFVLP